LSDPDSTTGATLEEREELLDRLLAGRGPFIDLRAPGEFSIGAVPGAVNLPLLSDDERHQVGLTFKEQGQAAAIARGEAIVSGAVKEERMVAWRQFIENNPTAWLYCWRGGLRSSTVQDWLRAEGVAIDRVPGGFKALRQRCLAVLDSAPGSKPWLILGGRTGTGKTVVLNEVPGSIDLEGLANHRGSAFGGALSAQPTPVNFENALAVDWLNHSHGHLLLEDESRTIGRLAVPPSWHTQMQGAPAVILEATLASRAAHIAAEYVDQPLAAGMSEEALAKRLQGSLDRIERRLGGLRHRQVSEQLAAGFSSGEHQPWIQSLLSFYYDPMYDYQLEKKERRIIFRGDRQAVREFLTAYQAR
jgi:tRNA 2-selenouridine synthase